MSAACEDLDDDHATAAARARPRVHAQLGWLHGLRFIGFLDGQRHGEQLAGACDVGHAIAGAWLSPSYPDAHRSTKPEAE